MARSPSTTPAGRVGAHRSRRAFPRVAIAQQHKISLRQFAEQADQDFVYGLDPDVRDTLSLLLERSYSLPIPLSSLFVFFGRMLGGAQVFP